MSFSLSLYPAVLKLTTTSQDGWPTPQDMATLVNYDGDSIETNHVLSSVMLNIITNFECSLTFGNHIQTTSICTSGSGGMRTCSGDSGGPLTVHSQEWNILVGVVSFGAEDGCQKGFPAAYTRVTQYLPWINAQ